MLTFGIKSTTKSVGSDTSRIECNDGRRLVRLALIIVNVVCVAIVSGPVQAQTTSVPAPFTLSASDFASASGTNPKIYLTGPSDGQMHSTRFGAKPILVNGAARFTLSPYNPDAVGNMLGVSVWTTRRWALVKDRTLSYQARIRFPDYNKRGFIPAFFAYTDSGVDSEPKTNGLYGKKRNEIDYEFVSNMMSQNQIWTNVFRNDGDAPQQIPADKFNNVQWNQWIDFKISWFPDRTDPSKTRVWWRFKPANSKHFELVREETDNTPVKDKKLRLHFNIWATNPPPQRKGHNHWPAAYDPSFQAIAIKDAKKAANKKPVIFEIQSAKVFYEPLIQIKRDYRE